MTWPGAKRAEQPVSLGKNLEGSYPVTDTGDLPSDWRTVASPGAVTGKEMCMRG